MEETLQKLREDSLEAFNALLAMQGKVAFDKVHDLEQLLAKLNDLQEQIAVLKFLSSKKQASIVESEIKAYVEESAREIESIKDPEDISAAEPEDKETEVKPPADEVEEPVSIDDESLKEQEKAMGLISKEDIHERQSEGEDHSLAKKLESQPISDLKKVIGLNERFYFANELFQGDGQEYARAIEEFNHLSSMDDANRLIEAKYSEKYHWHQHIEARDSFCALLKRRYMSNS